MDGDRADPGEKHTDDAVEWQGPRHEDLEQQARGLEPRAPGF